MSVLSEQHARHVTESCERQEQRGVVLALAGPVERQHIDGGMAEQLANARRSGRRDAVTDCHAGMSGNGACPEGWEVIWRGERVMMLSARSTMSPSTRMGMMASISPQAHRFSAVCTPAGNVLLYCASYTRGPRNPTRDPGSANVMCPSEPHDANTPPVVGSRR